MLKIADVCALLNVTPWTVYRYIREYGFPKPIKLNERTSRWDREAVEAWIASREGANA